ncbi:CPBP family intramembrane glutamic endopeptidase [Streptococcus himalayensis]|uniref:CAAX amino protease n=1 Tax=Streptococcus himalayensis TaxID=1888195 RepID=A0A917EFZ4_9STRE|nr:CPBP family intramembrane glutamic endopeptidase [Streptococcus himalayensis]GGE38177.1 CAAX amino protease [Streptococcus himalayensis]
MENMKQARRDVGTFSGLCLLYGMVMLLVSGFWGMVVTLYQALQHPGRAEEIAYETYEFLQTDGTHYLISVGFGVLIFYLYRNGKLFKSDLRTNKKMTAAWFFRFLPFLFFAQFAFFGVNFIFESILNLFGWTMAPAVEQASGQSESWTMFLYASILGPISEELIFRGAGLRTFETNGKMFAIVMSSMLFGVFHGNLSQFFFAAGVGLLFAYVTIEYSIYWAMLLHIINNLVISDGISRLSMVMPGEIVESVYLGLLGIGSILSILLLIRYRFAIKQYVKDHRPPKGIYQQVFRSPLLWIFILLLVYLSLGTLAPLG